MFLNNKYMAKMDEANIIREYSKYLQNVSIAAPGDSQIEELVVDESHFLSFAEFKDYYLLTLIGRGDDDYLNKLIRRIQSTELVQGL